MSYLDIYKKRMTKDGTSLLEARTNAGKRQANHSFTHAHGYHKAKVYKFYGDEGEDIDIVVNATTSGLEKNIMFRPDTSIPVGSYISYSEKSYIIREFDTDQITPKALAFLCNRYINFRGCAESIPCYTNSTTYGSKGILDQNKFYELDSKTKVYIQKNDLTDTLRVGQRIMFDHRYVYKITEVDDLVYDGMYIIICQRDEVLPMDDFDNNLAYNQYEQEVNSVAMARMHKTEINGDTRLKIGDSKVYTILANNGSWRVDDESIATLRFEGNTATLTGNSTGWVTLSYIGIDGSLVASIDILCAK